MTWSRALLLFAVTFAFAGSSCRARRSLSPSGTPAKGVLRRALAVEPAALPALDPSDGYARFVSSFVYQGLTAEPEREATGAWELRLAREIAATDDGRKLAVAIRSDVRFHDGAPLTLDDVVATFRFVLDPAGPASRLRAELGGLEAIRMAGPDRIELTWPQPWFRAAASLALVPILPARSIAAGPAAWAVEPPPGTGPFRVARWQHGQRLELERFAAGSMPLPQLAGITFRIVPDPSTQLQAFRAGELDIVNVDPGTFMKARSELESDSRWRVLTYPSTRVDVLYLNNHDGPCQSRRVRAAIAAAVDRRVMSDAFSGGLNVPIRGPVLPGADDLTGLASPEPPDVERARRALAALPAAERPAELVLRVAAGGPERGQVAEAIRDQLGRIGLKVRIEASDFGRLLGDVHAGKFDLVLLQVAVSVGEDPRDSWHSRGSANFARFADARVDELLDRARPLGDGPERSRLIRDAAAEIAAQDAAIYLWRVGVVTLASKRIEGIEPPHMRAEDVARWRLLPAAETAR